MKMANIKSAKKRINVIKRKSAENKSIRSSVKTAIRRFNEAVESGDATLASEKFISAEKTIYQASSKNVFHKNNASRKVSNLERKLNNLKNVQ